ANLAGDAVWYWAGRRWGYRVLSTLCRISLTPDSCVHQSETLIMRWGAQALIAAKFVPGVSVVAAPMAGALAMPWLRFVEYALWSGAIWTTLFMGLGAFFKTEVEWLLDEVARGGVVVVAAVLAAGIAAILAVRYEQRRRILRELAMPRISVDELRGL